jgi:hypothetical protein
MEAIKNTEFPKWLKRLQENSWEAEILISGGAIFSLFQLNYLIEDWSVRLREMHHFTGHNELYMFLVFGINGLTIGFFSNLILRGFWISLVCLNYSFPSGINFSKIKLKGIYLEQSKKVNLTDQILSLDHISGLLFFTSLTFVLVAAGVITFLSTFFLGAQLLGIEDFDYAFPFYGIPYAVFLLDSFGYSFLRNNKIIGKIYYPIYLFFNHVTLAFIYRSWFQILYTNTARWKINLIAGVFIFLTIPLTRLNVSRLLDIRSTLESRDYLLGGRYDRETFYENRIPGDMLIRWACIQSDIITDSYLRIFINYDQRYDEFISKTSTKDLRDIFSLEIDGTNKSTDWIWGERLFSNQYGITGYLPINEIQSGKHELKIHLKDEKEADFDFPIIISFWKQ